MPCVLGAHVVGCDFNIMAVATRISQRWLRNNSRVNVKPIVSLETLILHVVDVLLLV